MFNIPVLFLVFNRPENTAKVFQAIRSIQPKQLFIAADGPRQDKTGDIEKCLLTRQIVSRIYWDCEVKTLFRETNLGCKHAVSSAISWFFEQVEEGIILEDDTLPNESFFHYCQTLLQTYRNVPQIMHISGTNFQFGRHRGEASYYFSNYFHIWGWATWKRAWQQYDVYMHSFEPTDGQAHRLFSRLQTKEERHYWLKVFTDVKRGAVDTWDYQWLFSIWAHNGICITPNLNFISNIGFGQDATHTGSVNSKMANLKAGKMDRLIHPDSITVNYQADRFTFRKAIHVKPAYHLQLKNQVSQLMPESVKNIVKKMI